jgi:hypothetical protein
MYATLQNKINALIILFYRTIIARPSFWTKFLSSTPRQMGDAEPYDPALDLCSPSFDPVKAFAEPHRVRVPFPDIRPLDNIAMCHSRMFPKAKFELKNLTATDPFVSL